MARIRANNASGGGGGGAVATDTFTLSTASQQVTIDTGLGSSIKRLVIYGVSDTYPSPNGGSTTALTWSSDRPTEYFGGGYYGNASYTTTIGGMRYGAMALGIVSYDGNGKFVVDASSTASNSSGDYIWYAE